MAFWTVSGYESDDHSLPFSLRELGECLEGLLTPSARFTKDELLRLMNQYPVSDVTSRCVYLYRNKSESYFNAILQTDGIMKPYVKDNSGDPRNPINGKINGLFFMASVSLGSNNGKPIFESPFGSRRCLIPVGQLLDPSTHNLYFSDVFCMRGRNHYVTLVVTKKYSTTDTYCSNVLPQLGWYSNKYFRYDRDEEEYLVNSSSSSLIIEICYTESVDINGATFKDVVTAGKGSSTVGGLRKNPGCRRCNLLY